VSGFGGLKANAAGSRAVTLAVAGEAMPACSNILVARVTFGILTFSDVASFGPILFSQAPAPPFKPFAFALIHLP
jgi:hypothetical protein